MSTDELLSKCQYSYECPHRHQIMPVIFRMIYMCGLRASEARLLKITNVDLENGVLTINHSKKGLPKSDEKKVERCYNLGVQIIKKICKIEDNMAQ